jgi:hypothetical protein
VGRKSRAKALRRMERARNPGSGSASTPPRPRRSAGVSAPPASLDTRVAPIPLVGAERMGIGHKDRNAQAAAAPITMSPTRGPAPAGSKDPAERLRALAAERQRLDRAVEREVVALLRSGHPWTTIGRGLSLTRQGARQRYSRLLDHTG